MTSTISALTTGGGGIVMSGDSSGNLSLLSGATTVVAVTSAGVAVTGTLSASGAFTPNQTTGITGTTTNNDASTGYVGEYISSTVGNTTVTLTTGVTTNLTSISLTAGDWDVQGNVGFDTATTANLTYWYSGVTTNSATLQNGYYQATNMAAPTGGTVFGANAFSLVSPVARITLTGTTTVYLITNVGFTIAAVKAGGMIKARRVR